MADLSKRLEFKSEKSNKFWEVHKEGLTLTFRYGKMNTEGTSSSKTFETEDQANAQMEKKVKEKLKKGYSLVEDESSDQVANSPTTKTIKKEGSKAKGTEKKNSLFNFEALLKKGVSINEKFKNDQQLDSTMLPELEELEKSTLSKKEKTSLAHLFAKLFVFVFKHEREIWDEKYDYLLGTLQRLNANDLRTVHHNLNNFSFYSNMPWERMEKIIHHAVLNSPNSIAFYLLLEVEENKGNLLSFLPRIEEMLKEASEEQKNNIDLSVYRMFKDLTLRKVLWEEQYDTLISTFSRIKDSVFRKEEQYRRFQEIFSFLPKERAEKILLRNLQEPSNAVVRTLVSVGACPTEKTMAAFFKHIAEDPNEYRNNLGITEMFKKLSYQPTVVKELIQQSIDDALQTHTSQEFIESVRSNVGKSFSVKGSAKPSPVKALVKDPTVKLFPEAQKIQDLIDKFAQTHNGQLPAERVYLLLDSEKETDNNVIGGYPVGMNAQTHPKEDDQYLTFLFHLSFDTFPELKEQFPYKHTGVNIFMDTWNEIGSASLYSVESNTTNPGDYDYEPLEESAFFNAPSIIVPSITFKDLENGFEEGIEEIREALEDDQIKALRNIRRAIYNLPGHVIGKPIWLQEADRGNEDFILQFSESLAPVNLGDSGIMYVFRDGGHWQCY